MRKLIFWAGLIIIGVLCIIQYSELKGFDENFYSSLTVNLITEFFSILITVFVISWMLSKYEEEKEKKTTEKKEKKIISEMMGNKLEKYFCEISGIYVNFIYKKPITISGEECIEGIKSYHYAKEINKIINNIDDLLIRDFQNTNISFYFAYPTIKDAFDIKKIDYQGFCEEIFKPKFKWAVDELIHQYISIMPDGLRESIYRIENATSSSVFKTPLHYGLQVPIPYDEKTMNNLKQELLIIGKELLNVYKYINIYIENN